MRVALEDGTTMHAVIHPHVMLRIVGLPHDKAMATSVVSSPKLTISFAANAFSAFSVGVVIIAQLGLSRAIA